MVVDTASSLAAESGALRTGRTPAAGGLEDVAALAVISVAAASALLLLLALGGWFHGWTVALALAAPAAASLGAGRVVRVVPGRATGSLRLPHRAGANLPASRGFGSMLVSASAGGLKGVLSAVVGQRQREGTSPGARCAAAVALFAAVATLYSPPSEFVLGGLDPGVYLNGGVALARNGGFSVPDPLLAETPQAAEALVLRPAGGSPYLYPGFYWDDRSSAVFPQFPFLLTVWTGVAALIGGTAAALYVPLAAAILAIGAFGLFARRILGAAGALPAALLLAANGLELWHGRLSLAEEMVQAFLFAGLWAAVAWAGAGRLRYAVAAGLALGVLPLVKTEAVVLAALAVLGVAAMAHRKARHDRWLAATFTLCAALAGIAYGTAGTPVMVGQVIGAWPLVLTGAAMFAVLGCAVLTRRYRYGVGADGTCPGGVARDKPPPYSISPAGNAGGAARYGRPRRKFFSSSAGEKQRDRAPLLCAAFAAAVACGFALVPPGSFPAALWDASYLSPLDGVLLAAGVILAALSIRSLVLARSDCRVAALGVLAAGAAFYLAIFFYYYQRRDHLPLLMWSGRRLVPVVLPLAVLAETWTVQRLARLAPTALRPGAIALIILALLVLRWPDLAALRADGEYRGALQALGEVASEMEPGSIVLLPEHEDGQRLAAPLTFLFGLHAYSLWSRVAPAGSAAALASAAAGDGTAVYYLAAGPAAAAGTVEPFTPVLVGRMRFDLPELERISQGRPLHWGSYSGQLSLFRLTGPAPARLPLPLRVDVGDEQFPGYALLGSGFWPAEVAPDGTTYRWTRAEAEVMVPGREGSGGTEEQRHSGTADTGSGGAKERRNSGTAPQGDSGTEEEKRVAPGPRRVTMRLAAPRGGAGPVVASLGCDSRRTEFAVAPEFGEYSFALADLCPQNGSRLVLSVPPWVPAAGWQSEDRRALGLMVDWISLE